MSKVLIAYHADCIDGFTAAWIASKAMTEQEQPHDLLAVSYDDDSTTKLKSLAANATYAKLYIVDYSVPVAVLEFLTKRLEVVVLDHHKTAFESYNIPINTEAKGIMLPKYKHGAHILLDNTRSGAGITWAYFFPDQITPWLVRYVQDRDLWNFNYRDSKAIHEVLANSTRDFATWDRLAAMLDDPRSKAGVSHQGEQLLRSHQAKVADYVGESIAVTLGSYPARVVSCPQKYASDVGNELAKVCKGIGIIVNFAPNYAGIKYSLRSIGDLDVSAIAKLLDGGGHKNAASFIAKSMVFLPLRDSGVPTNER